MYCLIVLVDADIFLIKIDLNWKNLSFSLIKSIFFEIELNSSY